MRAGKEQAPPAVDEKNAKGVKNPVEALDETDAHKDEDAAHNHGADDSPEQHAMLLFFRNREVAEDQKKDEEVIDAEREFKNIAGDEVERNQSPLPEINDCRKRKRQCNPQSAPSQSLGWSHDAAFAVEELEVCHQHDQREEIEENPE